MDVGKLNTVPANLRKLNDVVGTQVVKNTTFTTVKTRVNKLDKKISDPTTLIHINQYNKDKQNLEKKNWRCWWKKYRR